jgi:hypothetical protein
VRVRFRVRFVCMNRFFFVPVNVDLQYARDELVHILQKHQVCLHDPQHACICASCIHT